ncbi:MAG: bifunctional DNA primase/polymerase, partial [Planctomycetes bacterium]|nr:bifunctional DNA primase/polymerase [Planctomycetota bacterium]
MTAQDAALPNCWAAAFAYAEKGQPVIPIYEPSGSGCSCAKRSSCEHAGKHPRWDAVLCPNGLDSATTNPELIRRMAARWPQANIAIRCDNLVVIDVDGDEGRAMWEQLTVEH